MAEKIQIGAKEPLYKAAEKINNAIDEVNTFQTQIDQLVVEGDSSVEAAQARVDSEGNAYGTLKERLDTENQSVTAQLAQIDQDKADKTELVTALEPKADKSYVDETLVLKANKTDLDTTNTNLTNTTNIANEALGKANNPLAALSTAGYKIALSDLSNAVLNAMSGTTGITTAKGYFENNRGVDFPLRKVVFNGSIGDLQDTTKNAILDAKIFGARVNCYYRITYIANGYVTSDGKTRYGVTLEERTKDTFATDGGTNRFIFIYNDDNRAGNSENSNWKKVSDNIETITIDNGEIALSLTIDRSVITASNTPTFLNLSVRNPSVIIDPSNYFF